jgi:hypothetical protein
LVLLHFETDSDFFSGLSVEGPYISSRLILPHPLLFRRYNPNILRLSTKFAIKGAKLAPVSNQYLNYYHDEYEEEKYRLSFSFDNDALHRGLHERKRQQVCAKHAAGGYTNRCRFVGRHLA